MKTEKIVIEEKMYILNGDQFKKITYDTGEQIYKGFDKEFSAWVTLRFKTTDDTDTINDIKAMARLLIN